jgi:hypothetical protein
MESIQDASIMRDHHAASPTFGLPAAPPGGNAQLSFLAVAN